MFDHHFIPEWFHTSGLLTTVTVSSEAVVLRQVFFVVDIINFRVSLLYVCVGT